ncbi:hypothetical protein BC826DRAFT_989998 [Russula brevipes]|nr:hypothetical protein BC826DRAFT_989998 [Russula brevipes]
MHDVAEELLVMTVVSRLLDIDEDAFTMFYTPPSNASTPSVTPLLVNSCEFEYCHAHVDGFATRGDLNPTVKAARKGAFKGSIGWLIKQLQ